MARAFNGTTDQVVLSPGACATLNGAFTACAVVKVGALPATRASAWAAGTAVTNYAGYVFGINSEGYPALSTQLEDVQTSLFKKLAVGKWYLMAITKPAGTQKVTGYLFDFEAGTWTAEGESEATIQNPVGTATQLTLGAAEPHKARYWNGAIALLGVWGSVLTQAQIETLVVGAATSYLSRWEALAPAGLWAFNQASVAEAVKDKTAGKADQTSISGTTVAAGEPVVYGAPTAGGLLPMLV